MIFAGVIDLEFGSPLRDWIEFAMGISALVGVVVATVVYFVTRSPK